METAYKATTSALRGARNPDVSYVHSGSCAPCALNAQPFILYGDPYHKTPLVFIGFNGGADFYASSVEELKKEGKKSPSISFDECRKDGVEPYNTFKGNVTTRLPPPERHQAFTMTAQAKGVSINELINEGVDWVIQKHA